tara:strand:+ start:52298 stop:53185 length:888 start_codon:yes stop_codon:yes gene_type:complete
MKPDKIRNIVRDNFLELEARERQNPDGYSFWLAGSDNGQKPQRLFRALSKSSGSEIKWAREGLIEQWAGTTEAFIERVRHEIDFIKQRSDRIPEGITRQNILDAILALDSGIKHDFSDSIAYDVLFDSRRYPPKAVVGVAAKFCSGQLLGPQDFKGGLKSICFRVLEQNGFEIVTKGDTDPFPDVVDEIDFYVEGSVIQTTVNRYERDPKARKKCISTFGPICQVCGMDFEDFYGAIGEGFIHVHHIKQLSEIGEEYQINPITDLVPVCPNCHSMLHKRKPPFSVNELKNLLKLI